MRTRYLSAHELAEYLGIQNSQAFENERKAGNIPVPDTVFNKMPYWSKATAEEVLKTQVGAIRAAFGYPAPVDIEGDDGDL